MGINIGCGDKFNEKLRDKHLIPYVPVYTQINLGIGGESNLQVPGQPIYLTSSQPDAKSLGYNGQGIVVIRLNDTEYACWDATCPNCQELTSHFTKEDLDGELAVCPVCHTQFSLRYGTPFNLTYEIYPLKGYPILMPVYINETIIVIIVTTTNAFILKDILFSVSNCSVSIS